MTMEYRGDIPDELDVRLERRDPAALDRATDLVLFQRISRGKNPGKNVHWTLGSKGELRVAWHSGDTDDWQQPFDVAIPDDPTATVPASVVRKVRRLLRRFADQPPYQVGANVKDGDFHVVTARVGDEIHEVIYEAVSDPREAKLLAYLREISHRYAEAGR